MTIRGTDFLLWSAEQHSECSLDTLAGSVHLDPRIVSLRSDTARLLDLLFGFATCEWGCAGTGHLIEGISGKCVSSTRAAIRLVDFGHYDEALALIRSVAEVANLFFLFLEDEDALKQWLTASRNERMKTFSPFKVRMRLEEVGSPIPYDKDSYRILSEAGTHPNPDLRPQSHNPENIQTVGGIYQEHGYVRCIVEIARSTAMAGWPAVCLTKLDDERRKSILQQAEVLFAALEKLGLSLELTDYQDATDSMERLSQSRTSQRNRKR